MSVGASAERLKRRVNSWEIRQSLAPSSNHRSRVLGPIRRRFAAVALDDRQERETGFCTLHASVRGSPRLEQDAVGGRLPPCRVLQGEMECIAALVRKAESNTRSAARREIAQQVIA